MTNVDSGLDDHLTALVYSVMHGMNRASLRFASTTDASENQRLFHVKTEM